jgi:hypothetical protein
MAVAGGAELTPRLRIASAAYAYLTERAANSDLLQGRDTTTFSRSTHNHDATYVNEGQASSVTSTMITDATVAAADLGQMGAATGQVMKWTGSAWVPRNDSIGSGGTADNAWVRVGGDSVLYTLHRLGVARGEAGNALHGTYRHSHVNFGVSCTTGMSGQNYSNVTVNGGIGNTAGGAWATVGGGLTNRALGLGGAIAGGAGNVAGDSVIDTCATVAGGYGNVATAAFATVGGGQANLAIGPKSSVAGGGHNETYAVFGAIGGGRENMAGNGPGDSCATVAGGHANWAAAEYAAIGGGLRDSASGRCATVAGGLGNAASGYYATVGGGAANRATSVNATVSGGTYNHADGYGAAVPGGLGNIAAGYCGFAAGTRAYSRHGGSFVWSDSCSALAESVYTTGSNQWRVRARGGAWFYSNLAKTTGAYLASGSNSWASACDSATKEDFREVDRQELLDKVAALRVRNYKMRDQDDGTRHIGPVAQDFAAAFGVGESDKSINMADADGVLLAAVQALYDEVRARDEAQQLRIAQLEAELAQLKK